MSTPANDPFNPRAAALAHAYTAAVGHGMQPAEPAWQADGIQAITAGLVYVGDQTGRLAASAERTEAMVDDVLLIVQGIIEKVGGVRRRPTPTDSWRKFLADQAAQIPAGVERAVRELTSRLTVSARTAGLELDGLPITANMAESLMSLTDWMNQLANVRAEVDDAHTDE